jgi:hypothetical protein
VAEIEIHHGHESDDFGKKVGVCVGVIGIILAGVTIESHRAHTDAVIYRTEANDQWAFYQSKKIREHAAEIASTTLKLLAPDPAKAEPAIAKLEETRARYAGDTDKIQEEAKSKEAETKHSEYQALRFDLGEGLLELGLVLSSLYFFSKRRLFPYIGITAATIGAVVGISGLFV